MREIEQTLEGSVRGRPADKGMLETLAEEVQRKPAELGRVVGKREAEAGHPRMAEFLSKLEEQIDAWRRF